MALPFPSRTSACCPPQFEMPSAQDPTLPSLSAVYHFLQEVFSRGRVGFFLCSLQGSTRTKWGAHVASGQVLILQRQARAAWGMMASWLVLSVGPICSLKAGSTANMTSKCCLLHAVDLVVRDGDNICLFLAWELRAGSWGALPRLPVHCLSEHQPLNPCRHYLLKLWEWTRLGAGVKRGSSTCSP